MIGFHARDDAFIYFLAGPGGHIEVYMIGEKVARRPLLDFGILEVAFFTPFSIWCISSSSLDPILGLSKSSLPTYNTVAVVDRCACDVNGNHSLPTAV